MLIADSPPSPACHPSAWRTSWGSCASAAAPWSDSERQASAGFVASSSSMASPACLACSLVPSASPPARHESDCQCSVIKALIVKKLFSYWSIHCQQNFSYRSIICRKFIRLLDAISDENDVSQKTLRHLKLSPLHSFIEALMMLITMKHLFESIRLLNFLLVKAVCVL